MSHHHLQLIQQHPLTPFSLPTKELYISVQPFTHFAQRFNKICNILLFGCKLRASMRKKETIRKENQIKKNQQKDQKRKIAKKEKIRKDKKEDRKN